MIKMVNWKEVAKFASGAAAYHAIGHLALGFSGLLPLIWFFGLTLTQELNTVSIITSAIVSILLAYYAWFKK